MNSSADYIQQQNSQPSSLILLLKAYIPRGRWGEKRRAAPVVVNSNNDVIVYANNTLAYAYDYNVISEAVVWH